MGYTDGTMARNTQILHNIFCAVFNDFLTETKNYDELSSDDCRQAFINTIFYWIDQKMVQLETKIIVKLIQIFDFAIKDNLSAKNSGGEGC